MAARRGKVTTPVHVVDKATKLQTLFDRIDLLDTRFEVGLVAADGDEVVRLGSTKAAKRPGVIDRFNETRLAGAVLAVKDVEPRPRPQLEPREVAKPQEVEPVDAKGRRGEHRARRGALHRMHQMRIGMMTPTKSTPSPTGLTMPGSSSPESSMAISSATMADSESSKYRALKPMESGSPA